MVLFLAAGMAANHLWTQQWAPPVAVLIGLLVAPMVPVPEKKKDKPED